MEIMRNTLIVVTAIIFLAALLFFERKKSVPGKLLTKTALGLLFILAAAIQSRTLPAYSHFLLIGLILCLGGDVLLVFPHKKAFLLGLASFSLGHICYILAFFNISQASSKVWVMAVLVCVSSGAIFAWLRPHLGSMMAPVIPYIIVISGMVIGGGSVLLDITLPASGRVAVFAGALLFYFSDICVARNRFVEKGFLNHLLGLPLYYSAQFLLAFAAGVLG
jgi:uncharacterized membrane protein YhhN